MTPKEFQKSDLTVELKAGRKRLEDALHGLSDEQCERAGATQSRSVTDVLTEIVTKEFLALMEVSDRLPSLPMNHPTVPTENSILPRTIHSFCEHVPRLPTFVAVLERADWRLRHVSVLRDQIRLRRRRE